MSWFDVDGDGWDDALVGGGNGGQLAVYRNDTHGGFQRLSNRALAEILARDQTTVLGLVSSNGTPFLLAGSDNYEDGGTNGSRALAYALGPGALGGNLPDQSSSPGPLALADVQGRNVLDLFIGGRCIPGRWPEPAGSAMYVWRGDGFKWDEKLSAPFRRVGLVNGAVFTDVNGDGRAELVVACDWGPLRLFVNRGGEWHEETREWGLDQFVGWWNGVAVGDFDGDGRLDLVASNWGLNSAYQNAREHQLVSAALNQRTVLAAPRPGLPLLYYGYFDGNGVLDLIEARFDSDLAKVVPVRSRTELAQGLPFLNDRFKSFAGFNTAAVADLLGDAASSAQVLQANWLASTVFLNRGDHFEAVALPAEAQFSPAFGVVAADFDGDGNQDVFLSQNIFALEPTMARLDAGRGVLLRGNGRGQFTAVPGQVSGVLLYGEGRGAAAGDYDRDGRVDLLAGQNGGQTKLYHNVRARPGLRVRLRGPAGNPTGIGAVLRLGSPGGWGPAHEIHAGSGYWSQDSPTLVLTTSGGASQLQVRWPGGKTVVSAVPPGAEEVTVDGEGHVDVTLVRR